MQKNLVCRRERNIVTRTLPTRITAGLQRAFQHAARRKMFLAMKLTALLLTIALLQVNAKGIAQSVTLTGKDLPLRKIFNTIEQQTGYVVFYNKQDLGNTTPVSLSVNALPLQEFLALVLKDQPLEFKVVNKTIMLSPKIAASGHVGWPHEQPVLRPVAGRVLDEDGNPLTGATIKVRGKVKGTITDAMGYFTINAEEGDVLQISFVGYTDMTIRMKDGVPVAVSGGSLINDPGGIVIRLLPASAKLNEIVVNAGYYDVERATSTGNIGKVDSKTISKQPVSNPLQALQGRVPGLYIQQQNGVPGSAFKVQIRGRNSIAAGNDPLFIVDGVPFPSASLSDVKTNSTAFGIMGSLGTSPLMNINPADIESIEILKDADATAIYGSKGANGVILITTKKAKAGKTEASVNVYRGISRISRRIELQSPQEYYVMRREAFQNDGVPVRTYAYDINGVWDTTRYTDWQKVLVGNNADLTNAQATLSGGNSNTKYTFGAGYESQGTVFPGSSEVSKISSRLNVIHTSSDQRFTAGFTANYLVNKSNMVGTDLATSVLSLAPNAPALYNEDGTLNWDGGRFNNPLADLERRYLNASNTFMSNVLLNYKILPGLDLRLGGGYNDMRTTERNMIPSTVNNPMYNMTSADAAMFQNTVSTQSWIAEPQLSYVLDRGESHIALLVGSTFQHNYTERLVMEGRNFPSDDMVGNIDAANFVNVRDNVLALYRYNAIFGRANYDYKQKYIVNITGRRDGSSRFGPGRQFGNFGAAGIAWVFSKEPFMQELFPALNFGKLRGSYGSAGNDQIGDYQFLNTYRTYGVGYAGVGSSGLAPARLYNPDFSWELNRKLEGGIELGFLNDRIQFDVSWYRNRSSNQLVSYPLSLMTGFSGVQANLPAVVQNTGWEFELQTINIEKKNGITWTSAINLTIPNNKLLAFPGLEGSAYASTYVIGEPLDIRRAFNYTGIDQQTGLYTVEDMNKDGQVTWADKLGSIRLSPQWYGAMDQTVSYKGLQVSLFFQFVKQKGYNRINGSMPGAGIYVQSPQVMDRWRKPGDQTNTMKFTQNYDYYDAFSMGMESNMAFGDISFARLKNANIAYQLPDHWLKMVRARIYVQGQNLFTVSNFVGADPEVGGTARIPPLATYAAGIQLNF